MRHDKADNFEREVEGEKREGRRDEEEASQRPEKVKKNFNQKIFLWEGDRFY